MKPPVIIAPIDKHGRIVWSRETFQRMLEWAMENTTADTNPLYTHQTVYDPYAEGGVFFDEETFAMDLAAAGLELPEDY